ncbi:hypothetical protein CDAR_93691 [Caerostris darwini]|uniref:Uncharacterized protein n=1 Tax=Caerostris darwini TaxID=1538125 RepID=A0AAV4NMK0_9ARAC|nr:hypothetical protein CDAR_93691 [Caerostris darwini]
MTRIDVIDDFVKCTKSRCSLRGWPICYRIRLRVRGGRVRVRVACSDTWTPFPLRHAPSAERPLTNRCTSFCGQEPHSGLKTTEGGGDYTDRENATSVRGRGCVAGMSRSDCCYRLVSTSCL